MQISFILLKKVQEALNAITECAKTGKGNLLELAVAAARERATVGEITQAMESVSFLHDFYTIAGMLL